MEPKWSRVKRGQPKLGVGNTHLNLFLVKRDAIDDVETRRLFGLGVSGIGTLKNGLVIRAAGPELACRCNWRARRSWRGMLEPT